MCHNSYSTDSDTEIHAKQMTKQWSSCKLSTQWLTCNWNAEYFTSTDLFDSLGLRGSFRHQCRKLSGNIVRNVLSWSSKNTVTVTTSHCYFCSHAQTLVDVSSVVLLLYHSHMFAVEQPFVKCFTAHRWQFHRTAAVFLVTSKGRNYHYIWPSWRQRFGACSVHPWSLMGMCSSWRPCPHGRTLQRLISLSPCSCLRLPVESTWHNTEKHFYNVWIYEGVRLSSETYYIRFVALCKDTIQS